MRNAFPASIFFLGLGVVAAQGCGSDAKQEASGPDAGGQTPIATGDAGEEPDAPSVIVVGGGDGGSAAGDASVTCSTTTKKAQKVPLDMVIGLDTSFSMEFDQKWTNIREALKSFVRNPANAELGIGLQFFPIRKLCSVADYAQLAVPLQLQPQAVTPIITALDAQQMADGTPMVPLLQGVTQYLKGNAKPDRRPVIVLATDGVPDATCLAAGPGGLANSLENAVAVAADAKASTPSIATFVIGVGGELSALDAIAKAGGTEKATLVDTGGNTEQLFLRALDQIRKQAIPCDYTIPDKVEDPTKTNVTFTPGSGPVSQFLFVGNEQGCARAPTKGWYFDDDRAPKKIILCADTCAAAKQDDKGRVDLVFGCPRLEIR